LKSILENEKKVKTIPQSQQSYVYKKKLTLWLIPAVATPAAGSKTFAAHDDYTDDSSDDSLDLLHQQIHHGAQPAAVTEVGAHGKRLARGVIHDEGV
jgi:hypothetical protein